MKRAEAIKLMEDRVAAGLDPLTGEPFATCQSHIKSDRHGSPVCSGCGKPVTLNEKGGWIYEA